MNSLNYSHHEGISCDHCMKSNFRGKRYKCLVCPDYDLCSSCYETGTVPAGKRHTSEHPVQCILTRNDYEIYFGGETNPVEQIQSFTCPICGKMGFTEQLLHDHSVQEHSETFTEVACPICCTMPNVEPGLTHEDFTSHLSLEHRSNRGYETPQAISLRGRRGPHTNRSGVSQNRNRRQLTPTTVTMLSNINPLLSSLPHDQLGNSSSQIRDLDPITELLTQLRRSQNANHTLSSQSFNQTNPLHLHLDRNFRGNTTLRQVFERPADIVVRRNQQQQLNQQTTQLNGTGLSYLLMDTANQLIGNPVPNNLTNHGQPSSNQFLLSTCKEKPKISKELEETERLNKSLFIQELLITSIDNLFKHDLKFEKDNSHLDNLINENELIKNYNNEFINEQNNQQSINNQLEHESDNQINKNNENNFNGNKQLNEIKNQESNNEETSIQDNLNPNQESNDLNINSNQESNNDTDISNPTNTSSTNLINLINDEPKNDEQSTK